MTVSARFHVKSVPPSLVNLMVFHILLVTIIVVEMHKKLKSYIPGVTQVEKGDEGNTAVVTAYICWRKHGIYLS